MLILPKLIPSKKHFYNYSLHIFDIINNIHCTHIFFYQILNYSNSTLITLYLSACYCLSWLGNLAQQKVYKLTLIYISTPTSINIKILISCSISKSLVRFCIILYLSLGFFQCPSHVWRSGIWW